MGKRLVIFSCLLLAPLAFSADKPDKAKPAAAHHSTHSKAPARKNTVSSRNKSKAHSKNAAKGKRQNVSRGKKKGLKKLAFWRKDK